MVGDREKKDRTRDMRGLEGESRRKKSLRIGSV